MKRLLLLLIVAGIVLYLYKTQILHTSAPGPDGERAAPIDRAKAAARASDSRTAAGEALGKEADQPQGGSVTENMTPDQVRHLLGSPDDVSTETTGSGATRETWVYRNVGKSVVFENGIVVGVQ